MHLGRFSAVVGETRAYLDGLNLAPTLDRALAQLQPYIANRSPANLAAFRAIVDELKETILDVPSSFMLPSVAAILDDLHIGESIGEPLYASLIDAISSPGILPEEIIERLSALRKDWDAAYADVLQLDNILLKRSVERESLGPTEAELGLGFPKEIVGETTKDLGDELDHISRLFAAFNEMRGLGSTPPKVRTISSSFWQFFLELDAMQVAMWTVTLERIVNLLKTNYEIKKLAKDLEPKKDHLPEGLVESINSHISSNIKRGIGELATELRSTYQNNSDTARCNELENQIRMELLHFARRINQGAVAEVRLGLPIPEPEEDAAQADDDTPAIDDAPSQQLQQKRVLLNAKLAELSRQTTGIELRQDLQLEGPGAASGAEPTVPPEPAAPPEPKRGPSRRIRLP